MDVIEVEDVFCLFGYGSFLLIVHIYGVCVYPRNNPRNNQQQIT